MEPRRLAPVLAFLILLAACDDAVRPLGGHAARSPLTLPPTAVARDEEPTRGAAEASASPTPVAALTAPPGVETDNREMSLFLTANLHHLRKYPDALRVSVVLGAEKMNLAAWPGTLVVDELRKQAAACGTPVAFVDIESDFDLLVGFAHEGRDGTRDLADRDKLAAAINRNRLRAAQSLADVLDVELNVEIDGDLGNAKGKYPWDRWHRFLDYKVPDNVTMTLLPRMPVETWREKFDSVIAEIAPAAPETDFKHRRTLEFRSDYLDGVMAICPNNFFADLMRRADINAPPDVVTNLLRDGRVRAGMTREQFQDASKIVLDALRPGR